MTIKDGKIVIIYPRKPELITEREREEEEQGLVQLSAVITTRPKSLEKSISIVEGDGPYGVPGEIWLGAMASGSTVTDIYLFNGEEIRGRDNVDSKIKEYVRKNYSHLLN